MSSRYKDEREAYQGKRIEELKDSKASNERIRFFEELIIFNELIKALVKWKKKTNKQTERDILKDLSFVPVMKCLYVNSLISVNLKRKHRKNSLFNIYNYEAFPKGPLNKDSYYFMDKLPEYTIQKDENIEYLSPRYSEESSAQPNFSDLINQLSNQIGISLNNNEQSLVQSNLTRYSIMLNKAVRELKKASSFPEFRERERLIDLTHMNLWKEGMEKYDSEMNTSRRKELIDEACFFRWRIGL